jgi:hypothetical protein
MNTIELTSISEEEIIGRVLNSKPKRENALILEKFLRETNIGQNIYLEYSPSNSGGNLNMKGILIEKYAIKKENPTSIILEVLEGTLDTKNKLPRTYISYNHIRNYKICENLDTNN